MNSLEEFNIELKQAEDYLDAMVNGGASKEDCANVRMLLDNINTIVRNLAVPVVIPSFTCCKNIINATEICKKQCDDCKMVYVG